MFALTSKGRGEPAILTTVTDDLGWCIFEFFVLSKVKLLLSLLLFVLNSTSLVNFAEDLIYLKKFIQPELLRIIKEF